MGPHVEIGARLRVAREECGLGLRETARLAGVAFGHLSEIEAGNRPQPGFAVVMRVALVLGVDPWTLIDLDGVEEEESCG
jgi:transcriptional regulator with XRE-family HTH domain